MTGQININQ